MLFPSIACPVKNFKLDALSLRQRKPRHWQTQSAQITDSRADILSFFCAQRIHTHFAVTGPRRPVSDRFFIVISAVEKNVAVWCCQPEAYENVRADKIGSGNFCALLVGHYLTEMTSHWMSPGSFRGAANVSTVLNSKKPVTTILFIFAHFLFAFHSQDNSTETADEDQVTEVTWLALEIEEGFLHFAARLVRRSERERKSRAAPVGMTGLGTLAEMVARPEEEKKAAAFL